MSPPVIAFYWDEHGHPEMIAPSSMALLSGFFAMEIKDKHAVSAWLIEQTLKVKSGELAWKLFTGESYEVMLQNNQAKISSEFSPIEPNPLNMDLSHFLAIAQKWDAFIQQPKGTPE